jgi:hypothetical protein
MHKKYTPVNIDQIKQKLASISGETAIYEVNMGSTILIVLAIWIVIVGISFYIARENSDKTNQNSTQQEAESLLKKVGELYDLPKGENPTIATISDKTKLQKQPFFLKAENGDKVIIYTNAKKAILYRPSIHKIMEIAPLALKET